MTKSKITDDLNRAIRQYVDQVELRDKLDRDFDALMETLDWDSILGPDEGAAPEVEDAPDHVWRFRLRSRSDYYGWAVPHLKPGTANHDVAGRAAAGTRTKVGAQAPTSLDWQQDGLSMRLEEESDGPQVYLTIMPAPTRDPSWMCWLSDPDDQDSQVEKFDLVRQGGKGFLVQGLKAVHFNTRVTQAKAAILSRDQEPRRFFPFVPMV